MAVYIEVSCICVHLSVLTDLVVFSHPSRLPDTNGLYKGKNRMYNMQCNCYCDYLLLGN